MGDTSLYDIKLALLQRANFDLTTGKLTLKIYGDLPENSKEMLSNWIAPENFGSFRGVYAKSYTKQADGYTIVEFGVDQIPSVINVSNSLEEYYKSGASIPLMDV